MPKKPIDKDVLTAAQERIATIFEYFPRIYLSFSGGKDSTITLHLAADEARRRGMRFGVLVVDLEAQYQRTIDHIRATVDEYADVIDLYWVALPLSLRNAVSVFEPKWQCWDPDVNYLWIRKPDPRSITDPSIFPFFHRGMEFEEFTPRFGEWYAGDEPTACIVAIRADESLHRYHTIAHDRKRTFAGLQWTTYLWGTNVYNCYPIYDWRTRDIWIYHAKTGKLYNSLYDVMHQAGLSIHQQRICQPFGDDQRRGLWLYHVLEPETWSKLVARVSGANSGQEFVQYKGNVSGQIQISKPDGHTWQSFCDLLLESMPAHMREHYENKIHVFKKWYINRGYLEIPDEADPDLERQKKAPSWRRVAKMLLRNDYWAKELSFSQTKSGKLYEMYMERVRRDRERRQLCAQKPGQPRIR